MATLIVGAIVTAGAWYLVQAPYNLVAALVLGVAFILAAVTAAR